MLGAVAELCLQRQISVDSSLVKIYYLGLNSILRLLTIGIEEVGGSSHSRITGWLVLIRLGPILLAYVIQYPNNDVASSICVIGFIACKERPQPRARGADAGKKTTSFFFLYLLV